MDYLKEIKVVNLENVGDKIIYFLNKLFKIHKVNIKIIKQIGSGGFSAVFEAEDLSETDSNKYIIKMIRQKSTVESFLHIMESEIYIHKKLSKLDSQPKTYYTEGIVPYLKDYFTITIKDENGNPYNLGFIISEKFHYDCFTALSSNLDIEIKKQIITQMVYKLCYLFLIHHIYCVDVKAENFVINIYEDDIDVRIIDFGEYCFDNCNTCKIPKFLQKANRNSKKQFNNADIILFVIITLILKVTLTPFFEYIGKELYIHYIKQVKTILHNIYGVRNLTITEELLDYYIPDKYNVLLKKYNWYKYHKNNCYDSIYNDLQKWISKINKQSLFFGRRKYSKKTK